MLDVVENSSLGGSNPVQLTTTATGRPAKRLKGEIESLAFKVFARPHPLTTDRLMLEFDEGVTLYEVLLAVQPDPFLRSYCHIFIETDYIHRKYWKRVYPKKGTRVYIRCVPESGGGGGGGKAIFRIILMIAIIAASFAIPGIGALGTTYIIGTSGLTWGALAQAGFVMVGGLLVNLIAPPPAAADASKGDQMPTKPTMYIQGINNSAKPFGQVPTIFGVIKLVPDFGALSYTEWSGNNQYLHVLLVLGQGPLQIWNQKFGDTPIWEYEDVQYEFKRGYQTWQLRNMGAWVYDGLPDMANYGYTYGMWWTVTRHFIVTDAYGSTEYWPGDDITYAGIYCGPTPRLCFDKNDRKPVSLYTNTVIEQTFNIQLNHDAGQVIRTTDIFCDRISVDMLFPGGIFYRDPQSGNYQNVAVHFHIQWRLYGTQDWMEAPVSPNGDGNITCIAATSRSQHYGYAWDTGNRAQYDVSIRRTSTDDTSDNFNSKSFWTDLRSIIYEPAINPIDGLCLVALRVKATNQLNGVINNFNCWAIGIQYGYDPSTGRWGLFPSQNPATAFYNVLTGDSNPRPITGDGIDWDSWWPFFWWCNNNGWSFNCAVNFQTSVDKLLDMICASGRASKTLRNGRKWGILLDNWPPYPVQHFTPRNSFNFSATRLYPITPHALRISYLDQTHDFVTNEQIVYDDGYWGGNATLFEQLDLVGVTNYWSAWRLGRFHLAQFRLRNEEYQFQTDMEYIVCERGDWVVFSHDVIGWGIGTGRIVNLLLDGSNNVTGIVIDEFVYMYTGYRYAVTIRTVDNKAKYIEILTPGVNNYNPITGERKYNVLRFRTVQPPTWDPVNPSEIDYGCLVSVGFLQAVTMDLMVKEIKPGDNLNATIVCTDVAWSVYNADQYNFATPYALADRFESHRLRRERDEVEAREGIVRDPIVDLRDGGNAPYDGMTPIDVMQVLLPSTPIIKQSNSLYPNVISYKSDTTTVALPGSNWRPRIQVNLFPGSQRPDQVTGIQAQYRPVGSLSNTWATTSVAANENTLYLDPVKVGNVYEFQLRYQMLNNNYGAWGPLISIVVGAPTAPMDPVTSLAIVRSSLAWAYTSPAPYFLAGFAVKYEFGNTSQKPRWDCGMDANAGLVTSSPKDIGHIPTNTTLMVRAQSLFGDLSSIAAVYYSGLEGKEQAIVTYFDYGGAHWPGTLIGMTVSGTALVSNTTTLYWATKTTVPQWTATSDLAWGTPYMDGVYTFSYVPGVLVGSADQLVVDAEITDGQGIKIEYQNTQGSWVPWVATIVGLYNLAYNFRVTYFGGRRKCTATSLRVFVYADVISEPVNNFVVGTSGTRYALQKQYRSLMRYSLKYFGTVPSGVKPIVTALDLSISPGPLLEILDTRTSTPIAGATSGTITGVAGPGHIIAPPSPGNLYPPIVGQARCGLSRLQSPFIPGAPQTILSQPAWSGSNLVLGVI